MSRVTQSPIRARVLSLAVLAMSLVAAWSAVRASCLAPECTQASMIAFRTGDTSNVVVAFKTGTTGTPMYASSQDLPYPVPLGMAPAKWYQDPEVLVADCWDTTIDSQNPYKCTNVASPRRGTVIDTTYMRYVCVWYPM